MKRIVAALIGALVLAATANTQVRTQRADRDSLSGRLEQLETAALPYDYEAKRVTIVIPPERVLTLFSNHLEVVPARSGYQTIPMRAIVSHEEGTSYTAVSSFDFAFVNGTFSLYGLIGAPNFLMDDASSFMAITPGGTGGAFAYVAFVPPYSGTHSRALTFRANGANPVGGTWGITIDLWYVEVPVPAHSNMVGNGGIFTGSAATWTLGLGGGAPDWAYSSNAVTHGNGGGTAPLRQITPLFVEAGHSYRVRFTISGWSAGTVTASIGGVSGTPRGADGTFTETIVATTAGDFDDTSGDFLLTPTTTFVGVVDNVHVSNLSAP